MLIPFDLKKIKEKIGSGPVPKLTVSKPAPRLEFKVGEGLNPEQAKIAQQKVADQIKFQEADIERSRANSVLGKTQDFLKYEFSVREEPVPVRRMFEAEPIETKAPPIVTQLGGLGFMFAEMIPKGLATVYGQFLAPKEERKTGSVDLGFNAKRLGFEEETFSTAEKRIIDCQNAGGSAFQCGLQVASEMSADVLFPAQLATAVLKTVEKSLLKSGVEKTINAWDLLNKPTVETIEKNKAAELTKVFESVKDLPEPQKVRIVSQLNNELNKAVKLLKDKGIPSTVDQVKYKVAKVAEVGSRETKITEFYDPKTNKLRPASEILAEVKSFPERFANPDYLIKNIAPEPIVPFKQLPGTRERPNQAPAFGMSTKEVENVGYGSSKIPKDFETTYRGASKAEWETIKNGGSFGTTIGQVKDDFTGKLSAGQKTDVTWTINDKKYASNYVKEDGVLIEFKPEAKTKMSQVLNESGGGVAPDNRLNGKGLTLDDVAKVTDKNGKVIYQANTGYKETGNLSTKILQDLEGKTTVSKQYILDATNRGELKQVEREITRQVLDTIKGDKVNVKEFAEKVKSELLPLKRLTNSQPKYENIGLPDKLKMPTESYQEHIYSSPIKTSAGNVHFSEIEGNEGYYGHIRSRNLADGKTRVIDEVQSDLYQKGNLEREIPAYLNASDYLSAKDLKEYNRIEKRLTELTFADNSSDYKDEIKELQKQREALQALSKDKEQFVIGNRRSDVAKLQQYNDPTAHFRMVREEVKKAAIDGKTKLQFPTGETAMKIEGLGEPVGWRLTKSTTNEAVPSYPMLTPDMLKVGENIHRAGAAGHGGEWIITDVLKDGKFKAIPKDHVPKVEYFETNGKTRINMSSGLTELYDGKISGFDWAKERNKSFIEEFDISGKVDTNNPIYKFYEKDIGSYLKNKYGASKVTDDKGVTWWEVPIKEEYASQPVQAFGVTAGLEQDDDGNPRFNPIKAAFGIAGFTIMQKSGAIKAVEEMIAKGKARIVSRSGKDVFQVKKGDKWVTAKSAESVVESIPKESLTKAEVVEQAAERAKAGEDFGSRDLPLEFNPTKAALDVPGFTAIEKGGELTMKNLDDLAKKMANKYASRATLEQIRAEIAIAEEIIGKMPGKTMIKFISKKEGQFENFKNPDIVDSATGKFKYTEKQRIQIREYNEKVTRASQSAFEDKNTDNPLESSSHDNPDVIRESIEEYIALRDKIKILKQNAVTVREELSAVRMGEYLMQLAKGERRAAYKSLGEAFNLTDAELAEVRGRKDIMAMTEPEFKDFMKQAEAKAGELEELSAAKIQLDATIKDKDLMKWENLQQAMKLPKVNEMTIEQVRAFENTLLQYKTYDEFLTVRQLETIDKTELTGLKTVREVIEHLAKKTGVTVDEAAKAKPHPWMYDTQLQRQDPFNKLLVDKYNESFLKASERAINITNEDDKLINLSRQSRERKLADKLIPEDPKVVEWLESDTEKRSVFADSMTTPELNASKFQDKFYRESYDWMVKREIERKFSSRYEDTYYPHMPRGFLEAWKNEGFIKAFGEQKIQYKQNEAFMTILNEKTGEIIPYEKWLPMQQFRTGNLVPSKNAALVFKTYVHAIEKAKQFDEFIPEMMIYANSLSPRLTTEKGVEINDTLQTFFKKWINSKKGRTEKQIITPGGKADWALRTGTALLRVRDLGLNLATQVASAVGEQAGNVVMLRTKYPLGVLRLGTARGRAITRKYENFVGKSIYDKFTEASTDVGDKLMTGIMGIFGEASRKANQTFLLSMMTKEEFNSGTISIKRLAELRNKMGRYRVVEGAESIIGKSAEMAVVKQHKKWAIPIIVTTASNFKILAQAVKKDGIHALKSEAGAELLTATLLTATIGLGSYGYYQELDKKGSKRNAIEDLVFKLTRESLSLITALDPKFIVGFATPRLVSFFEDITNNLESIVKMEEYADYKGGLKGPKALMKTLTPVAVNQFIPEDAKSQLKSKIQELYDKYQELKKEGKESEAQTFLDESFPNTPKGNADYEIYKDIKTSEKRKARIQGEKEIYPIYLKNQKLKAEGKLEEVSAIMQSLTEEQNRVYQLVKKREQESEPVAE